jgi:hypothetical protein
MTNKVTITVTTLEGIRIVHVKDDKWVALDRKGNRVPQPKGFWERHRSRGRPVGKR